MVERSSKRERSSMNESSDLENYKTITEVQNMLGVTNRQVILNHVKRKNLGVKIGWNWLIPVENIETLRASISEAK